MLRGTDIIDFSQQMSICLKKVFGRFKRRLILRERSSAFLRIFSSGSGSMKWELLPNASTDKTDMPENTTHSILCYGVSEICISTLFYLICVIFYVFQNLDQALVR